LVYVLIYALIYSGFCFLLDAGGHQPSFGALTDRHYLLQAVLLVPAMLLLWLVQSWVAHRIGRALGGRATLPDLTRAMAPAIAIPMLLLFVLPDLIVYLLLGFDAIAEAMRFYAPLALAARLAWTTAAIRRAHAISTPRSVIPALAALVVEALATAPWLR
jgi:hypothetical protein